MKNIFIYTITLYLIIFLLNNNLYGIDGVELMDKKLPGGLECIPTCRWICNDPNPNCKRPCEPICDGEPECRIKCKKPCPRCETKCEEPVCEAKCHNKPRSPCELKRDGLLDNSEENINNNNNNSNSENNDENDEDSLIEDMEELNNGRCGEELDCDITCTPGKCNTTCSEPEPECDIVCEDPLCKWKCGDITEQSGCEVPKCFLSCPNCNQTKEECCGCSVPTHALHAFDEANLHAIHALEDPDTDPVEIDFLPTFLQTYMQVSGKSPLMQQCCPCSEYKSASKGKVTDLYGNSLHKGENYHYATQDHFGSENPRGHLTKMQLSKMHENSRKDKSDVVMNLLEKKTQDITDSLAENDRLSYAGPSLDVKKTEKKLTVDKLEAARERLLSQEFPSFIERKVHVHKHKAHHKHQNKVHHHRNKDGRPHKLYKKKYKHINPLEFNFAEISDQIKQQTKIYEPKHFNQVEQIKEVENESEVISTGEWYYNTKKQSYWNKLPNEAIPLFEEEIKTAKISAAVYGTMIYVKISSEKHKEPVVVKVLLPSPEVKHMIKELKAFAHKESVIVEFKMEQKPAEEHHEGEETKEELKKEGEEAKEELKTVEGEEPKEVSEEEVEKEEGKETTETPEPKESQQELAEEEKLQEAKTDAEDQEKLNEEIEKDEDAEELEADAEEKKAVKAAEDEVENLPDASGEGNEIVLPNTNVEAGEFQPGQNFEPATPQATAPESNFEISHAIPAQKPKQVPITNFEVDASE